MRILKVLSLLMDYPTSEIVKYSGSLMQEIEMSELERSLKSDLIAFLNNRISGNVMNWQADYDALFERGRSLSLLLFEHVHGESRDRGQAMVDLMNQYKLAGLQVQVNELPDYLPLYLEFLSTQGEENARLWLQEIAHILTLLTCRLQKRKCDYEVLFRTLLSLSGCKVDWDGVKSMIVKEHPDDTPEALDKVWEEEAVTFGPDQASGECGAGIRKPAESQRRDQDIPLHWTDMHQSVVAGKESLS